MMITINQLLELHRTKTAITIAIVGDSTTSGFGANPSPNLWTNGLSYACVNQPRHGENWQPFLVDGVTANPLYINTTGFPTQAQQDNTDIPSAVRLFRTYLESRNASSKVYNYGGSGYTAGTHVANSTIATVANLTPKPDAIFFNLGINSAKNNVSQNTDLRTLVAQAIANDILPVLVKPNNVGVALTADGSWSATSCPNEWVLMDNWQTTRDNIGQIASDNGLRVIDLGTDNTLGDTTLLYDSFHPSNLGYVAIATKYANFLNNPFPIRTLDGKLYSTETNSLVSAVRFKLPSGQIVKLPVSTSSSSLSKVRIRLGQLVTSFQ